MQKAKDRTGGGGGGRNCQVMEKAKNKRGGGGQVMQKTKDGTGGRVGQWVELSGHAKDQRCDGEILRSWERPKNGRMNGQVMQKVEMG